MGKVHSKLIWHWQIPGHGMTHKLAAKLYRKARKLHQECLLETDTWLRKEGPNYAIYLNDARLVTIHRNNSYTIAIPGWEENASPSRRCLLRARNRIATWASVSVDPMGRSWQCTLWRKGKYISYPFFNGIKIARDGRCMNLDACPPAIHARYKSAVKRAWAMREFARKVEMQFPREKLERYCRVIWEYAQHANRDVLYFFDGLWGFAIDRRQESPYVNRYRYTDRHRSYMHCWAWNKLGQSWQFRIPKIFYWFLPEWALPSVRKQLGEIIQRMVHSVPELAAEYTCTQLEALIEPWLRRPSA